jgi:hypothetical protein
MARTDPQVNFRIPAELLEQIKDSAEKNNRTITAEVVSRLQLTFAAGPEQREWLNDVAVKYSELVAPTLVEMARIEKETRIALADKGLTPAQISDLMKVKVDPGALKAEVAKRRAKKS